MPPPTSSRKDSNPHLKAQDKETKRARGALSCAECRRLKLKCDKTVPCSSCKRRGCSAICPNGSLITGQGTRFVLADTEKLHQKIAQMSDRIRQLEDAVAILQSTLSSEPHPLLSRELLKIKSSIELHAAIDEEVVAQSGKQEPEDESVIDAFGTLAIRDDGAATFYGRSAGSESLLIGESTTPHGEDQTHRNTLHQPRPLQSHLPSSSTTATVVQQHLHAQHARTDATLSQSPQASIASLGASFPLSANAFQNIHIDMDYLLVNFLPKWEEGWRLSQLYLEQAPWFFGAVTKRQLSEEMLPMWYYEARGLAPTSPLPGGSGGTPLTPVSPIQGHSQTNAASPGSYSTSSSSSSTTHGGPPSTNPSQTTRTAHDLALLFMIFCFGALTDINLPSAPDNATAEEYYQLTKAALVLEPVLERPPSVATVQTLSLMAIYEGICSRDGSIERTWSLFGIAVKLAQSIGLHRDCARWKLSPAEVQKRRALFWELFITDCWQSLATGRLSTFSLPFVDCELPMDPDQIIAEDGSIQPSFPHWKARFGAECVSAVVQGTLTSRAPKYSIILDLDRKVRDMELPLYAQQAAAQDGTATERGLGGTMSRFMPINYRELTLLYIHRCFFAHAISTHPNDPIKSQYAPSFLAGYRSASTILGSVRQQFMLFPRQISRFWVLWTHAFSATVMLASVATHVSKQSQVAHAAFIELKAACELFEHAAKHGGRAVKFLPILQRLQAKAQKSFEDSQNGVPANIPNDILKPSRTDDEKNELEIFGGKTHTVATKTPGTRPALNGNENLSSSRESSGSPQVVPHVQIQAPPQVQQQYDHPRQQQTPTLPLHQQRQLVTQYPSFEGVHPSLVNELHGFGGRIEAQIRQAYLNQGADVGEDGGGSEREEVEGVGDENEMVGVEFQQQQEMEYQQQQQQQQMEMEQQRQMQIEAERRRRYEQQQRSEEAAARERKRVNLGRERESLKSVKRERQEYEAQRQPQQYEQYQPRPAPPPAYQTQPPAPSQPSMHQYSQPQQNPQYNGYYLQPQPPSDEGRTQQQQQRIPPPLHHPPQHQLSQSQSHPNLRQSYAQGQGQMYQSHAHAAAPPPPPPLPSQYQHHQTQNAAHRHPVHAQHQQLHVVPPQYAGPGGKESVDMTLTTPSSATASSMSSQQTPVTPYDVHAPYSQQFQQQPGQSPPHSLAPQQQGYSQGTYTQYWAAAPNVPEQQPQQQQQHSQYPQHQQPQPGQQQYTPTGVLKGIAADDSRLQETWQTYMYNVASPKPFFD